MGAIQIKDLTRVSMFYIYRESFMSAHMYYIKYLT